MRRNIFLIILISLALVCLVNLSMVSGEIIFSQLNNNYNYGDVLNVNIDIQPNRDVSGFLALNLNCGGNKINFHKEALYLKTNEKKIITSNLLLVNSIIEGKKGECNIGASFGNENETSQEFEISDEITMIINTSNLEIEPGTEIEIKGTAEKKDLVVINGFAELEVGNTNIKVKQSVNSKDFSIKFMFPETTKAGEYNIKVKIYEKSNDEITNQGEGNIKVKIKQIPTSINIIANEEISPNSELSFSSAIYDQADENFAEKIGIKIYNSNNKLVLEKIIESGTSELIYLPGNSTPGNWKIKADALGLTAEKSFNVKEYEKAEFKIENNTLIITNVGNVPYKKAIQISIGEHLEVKNVELDVDKKMELKLKAPDGNYNLEITDGNSQLKENNVALTGQSIGIDEVRTGVSLITGYPIAWLFLILVCGLCIFVMYQRIKKKNSYSFPVGEKQKEIKEIKNIVFANTPEITGDAEHTLVLSGSKQNVGILALKLSNLEEAKKKSPEILDSVSNIIKENKGTIYNTKDFIMGLFSPTTTKTTKNEILGVKTARQINDILKQHNKRAKLKISYGMSLNSGEAILNNDSGKIKFTGIGNLMPLSKKIANISQEEILLSDSVAKRVMGEVKTNKETREGIDVYHIERIIERDTHKKFIDNFLDRQNKGK